MKNYYKTRYKISFFIVFITLIVFFFGFLFAKILKNIPFVKKSPKWSIGIYLGNSPFNLRTPLNIMNPVISSDNVTDIKADFVADPFCVRKNGRWYMFFEVLNSESKEGDIGVATSYDGFKWEYQRIVLDEPFHLSYPYVFKWNDRFFMIPESWESNSLRLYEATEFPLKWKYVKKLLKGIFIDPSIIYYNELWWLFSSPNHNNDTLVLYYARDLVGPWLKHPNNPIIAGNANIARPGGRVIIYNNELIRFAQDDEPNYGNQVWGFKITELTKESYKEKILSEFPILRASGTGWNRDGMHNIDPYQINKDNWIGCVDGFRFKLEYGIHIR